MPRNSGGNWENRKLNLFWFIDLDGKYGMTQHSMAIKVDNKYEALNIKNAIFRMCIVVIILHC